MQYEERITIDTPEGVALDFPLAGVGSRFTSALIDLTIQLSILGCVVFVLAFIVGAVDAAGVGTGFAIALFSIATFLCIYGYDIAFLTLRSGQTPGKEVMGLRVVLEGGLPVDFKAATIRTVLGLIDGPLTLFIVGTVSIIVSPRNQRLGDIAAGTLVIRERTAADRDRPPPPPPGFEPPPPAVPVEETELVDLGGVSDADLATVRAFLGRRTKLDADARARLADQLAERLRPLVAGAPGDADPEQFLETVAAAAIARR